MTPRQREIVEQSISLIASRGIQDLTIRNIADAIGISEPAIYRHFRSKTDVILAVIDSLEQSVFGTSETHEDGTDQTLSDYISRLFVRFNEAPELASVVFSDEIFMNDQLLVQRIRALMERSLAGISKVIIAEQQRGTLRNDLPASDLSLVVVGTIRLIVRQWHISEYGFDLAKKGKSILRSLDVLISSDA